jgi:hypothetical protein
LILVRNIADIFIFGSQGSEVKQELLNEPAPGDHRPEYFGILKFI